MLKCDIPSQHQILSGWLKLNFMSANAVDSRRILCRYFANGCCNLGDRCSYSHDRSKPPDNVCRYYLSGNCCYGAGCRYDHIRPKKNGETNSGCASESTKKSAKIPKPAKLPKPGLNADAAEFVPSWKKSGKSGVSYAVAAGSSESEPQLPLCPYFEMGECTNDKCQFVHGLVCDMCLRACIHPYDEKQQKQHFAECLQQHEMAMEQAFAEAKGKEKCCGICMENIMEKSLRFGILENCRHCFCLECIREWRRNQAFDTDVVRSCPECRQHSNFVIPSILWVEDDEEKKILCEVYRTNMAQKQCKYYKEGSSGEGCPFGNKCFYKHQLPDGSIDPGEAPHARRKPYLSDFIFRRDDTDDADRDERDQDDLMQTVNDFITQIRAILAERNSKRYCGHNTYAWAAKGNRIKDRLKMYARVLDERQIARDLIDAIRSTTDAPLNSCIEAARNCLAVMAPFVQVESFQRIQEAVKDYTVQVDDCYDYRLLSEMQERLTPLFKEKYELSFSSEQDDEELLMYLGLFVSCVQKTDPRVVKHLISLDDYEWMDHLINIYQMDQNDAVRLASLKCIVSLVDVCSDLITYILNSRLPEVVAVQFQSRDTVLSELDLTAIRLLILTYSSGEVPPLHHFELFDAHVFVKLLSHIHEYPNEIMEFIVNFNGVTNSQQKSAVIAALQMNPCPQLGQLLVKAINDQTTERRLKLLSDIIEDQGDEDNLYSQLFYSNDLHVLSNILARELTDCEDIKIRSQCMKCIRRLAQIGHCSETAQEAVLNSDFDNNLRLDTLNVIQKNKQS
ncbi:unnamed protein product [Cylicocyclus nassatus]|uniref:RING-type E3 ubiquitin transferase n=1 Tax=Cylicocyclus nassatus TaxID=53992 RepID=A0AA36H1L7_CYLNA|nr:unnamed protein product [Cylicocyclus nassatus]